MNRLFVIRNIDRQISDCEGEDIYNVGNSNLYNIYQNQKFSGLVLNQLFGTFGIKDIFLLCHYKTSLFRKEFKNYKINIFKFRVYFVL